MASLIGQLLVELGINTAAFKGGLDKATYEGKQFARELKKDFGELGSSVKGLASEFGSMNPLVRGMGEVMHATFSTAATALSGSGGLGGAAVVAGAAVVGLGAVALAAAAGLGELAVQGMEVVHRLDLISQKTGISIRDLQVFEAQGKTVGVTLEDMVTAMRKFEQGLVGVGKGGAAAQAVLKSLGVTARDPKEALLEVAEAFKQMEDGPLKAADAVALFGRSGLNMIPALNKGKEGFAEFSKIVDDYGPVIGKDAVEANEKYEKSVTKLSLAWDSLKTSASGFIGVVSDVTTGTAVLVHAAGGILGEFVNHTKEAFSALGSGGMMGVFIQASLRNVGDASAGKEEEKAHAEKQKRQQETLETQRLIFEELKAGSKAEYELDQKKKEVEALVLAQKYDLAAAAQREIPALEEAVRLTKERKKALEDLPKAMQKEVGGAASEERKAQAAAMRDSTAAGIEAAAELDALGRIEKLEADAKTAHIEKTKAFAQALAEAIPQIKASAIFMEAFKAATGSGKELDSFNKKIREQVTAMEGEAEAGTVVEKQWAKNTATLQPLRERLTELIDEYDKLSAQYGSQDKRTQDLGAQVVQLTAKYNAAAKSVGDLNTAFQKNKAQEEGAKLDAQILSLTENIKAMRGAGDGFLNIDLAIARIGTTAGLTAPQLEELRLKMQQIRDLQIQQAVAQRGQSAGFDKQHIASLNAEAAALKKAWESGTIGADEYHKVLTQINKETADLEAKTGGFTKGVKAGFADLAAEVQTGGEMMHEVTGMAIKGIGENFAEMVTTGKAHWSDLVTSMEQMLLKSAINNILNSLFNSIGGMFGGSGGGFGGFMSGIFGGKHAQGGDVTPGKAYLVGENGPELYTPGVGGTITPNDKLQGGGQTIHQNFYISTPDADSFRKSRPQVMADMYAAQVASARRNRG